MVEATTLGSAVKWGEGGSRLSRGGAPLGQAQAAQTEWEWASVAGRRLKAAGWKPSLPLSCDSGRTWRGD